MGEQLMEEQSTVIQWEMSITAEAEVIPGDPKPDDGTPRRWFTDWDADTRLVECNYCGVVAGPLDKADARVAIEAHATGVHQVPMPTGEEEIS